MASFYHISDILDKENDDIMKALWKTAIERGYEVADHSMSYNKSKSLTLEQWKMRLVAVELDYLLILELVLIKS